MVVKHIQRTLVEKSKKHRNELQRLGEQVEDKPLSPNVLLLKQTRQIVGMNTIIQNPMTDEVDFIFYFDRLATLLVERYDYLAKIAGVFTHVSAEPWTTFTSKQPRYRLLKEALIKDFR